MFLDTAAVQDGAMWFEYLKPILDILVPIVASGVGLFLTYLFKRGLDFLREKHGFEVDSKVQQRIQQTILDGIALAEQQAIKSLKQGQDAPDGAKKLKIAVDYIYESLKEQGYGEIPEEKIEQWVELLLAQVTDYTASPEITDAAVKDRLATANSLYLPMSGSQFFLNGKNTA